jgi:uncharacterized membrane protein
MVGWILLFCILGLVISWHVSFGSYGALVLGGIVGIIIGVIVGRIIKISNEDN